MIKVYVTRTRYHRVGHIFITFIYSLSAVRDIFKKYLIALTFSGLSENASHIYRNPASASYTSVVATTIRLPFDCYSTSNDSRTTSLELCRIGVERLRIEVES